MGPQLSLLDLAAAARVLLAGGGSPVDASSAAAAAAAAGVRSEPSLAQPATQPPAHGAWGLQPTQAHPSPAPAPAAAAQRPPQAQAPAPAGVVRPPAQGTADPPQPLLQAPFQMRLPAGRVGPALASAPASPGEDLASVGLGAMGGQGAASPAGSTVSGSSVSGSSGAGAGGPGDATLSGLVKGLMLPPPAAAGGAAPATAAPVSALQPQQQPQPPLPPAASRASSSSLPPRRRAAAASSTSRSSSASGGRSSRASSPSSQQTPASAAALSTLVSNPAAEAVLGEGGLVLQAGRMGGRVGLLPGLRPRLMGKYDIEGGLQGGQEEAGGGGKRAPREDLTGYSAEAKVARRKARARVYSQQARQRQEQAQLALADEVDVMRVFRSVVEEAPLLLLVLSADVRCTVLYANEAAAGAFAVPRPVLLGSSFWHFVHPGDQPGLLARVSHAILTQEGPSRRLRCRLRRGAPDPTTTTTTTGAAVEDADYRPFSLGLTFGTQGLVCTLWQGHDAEAASPTPSPTSMGAAAEGEEERARQRRRLEEGYFTFAPSSGH